MISIKNLSKSYGNRAALDRLNLCVGKGTILGLLGPNGAGKTTLVSTLNGLTNFQEGEIKIFGLPLHKNIKAIRKRSAFVPQSLAFYDQMSVVENLRFFAGIQSVHGTALHDNIDYALSVNRLHKLTKQKACTLSGGQKRRLNIAIGLLNNPDILYFDEPTVGIDPESRGEILETIRSFKKENKTVLYTSHYMEEIEKICDDVAILHHGKILCHDSLENLLQQNNGNCAIIECMHTDHEQLGAIASRHEGTKRLNTKSLILHQQSSKKLSALLADLEAEHIQPKHIHFDSTSLESLFIRLTSHGQSDA